MSSYWKRVSGVGMMVLLPREMAMELIQFFFAEFGDEFRQPEIQQGRVLVQFEKGYLELPVAEVHCLRRRVAF